MARPVGITTLSSTLSLMTTSQNELPCFEYSRFLGEDKTVHVLLPSVSFLGRVPLFVGVMLSFVNT